MANSPNYNGILRAYENKKHDLELFMKAVESFFRLHPVLNRKEAPYIHSIKSRFKDSDHLKDKIKRKHKDGELVTPENLSSKITDLIGVRVLHLYQEQLREIHEAIIEKVKSGDWKFRELPKVYSWDPESKPFYQELNLKIEIKPSFYTSVHYVVTPNNKSTQVCCEIQVRTLFEEIWGEIDHTINYPHTTNNISCKEQLRVLSKLVSTGTRLADSIFRTYKLGIQITASTRKKR